MALPSRPPVHLAILTVIPAELEAARRALGIDHSARERVVDGSIYYRAIILSGQRDLYRLQGSR